MFDTLNGLFGRKPAAKGGPLMPEPAIAGPAPRRQAPERKPTFSKVFRWRLPDGQTAEPKTVEVVGSFTHWQKVPLVRDSALDAWHVTIHHIQGHRTHHYMLLIDGRPAYDRNSDGVAIPHGAEEEQYQLITERGPRVFMLFAQAK